MKKKSLFKMLLLSISFICFGVQILSAQDFSSERELQVVSFLEADKTDFDVTTPSNFAGNLSGTALVKVFMPGEIASCDPISLKNITRKLSPGGGGYASYLWIPAHSNSLKIFPKGSTFQPVKVNFKDYNISVYSLRNKEGGLQAGKVYHLVLRDPAPVYIDTHLQGAYATVDNNPEKMYADSDGRITLKNLSLGTHVVNVFSSDGNSRGSVKIDDMQKIYTLDVRKKTLVSIKTNPEGGVIKIVDGEATEDYNPNKEYAYKSYKVMVQFDDNTVEREITVNDNHKSFVINNTRTYTIAPMYNGQSVSATVWEDGKLVEEDGDNVVKNGSAYRITRPIGEKHRYDTSNSYGKSDKVTVKVNNRTNSEYQLVINPRNRFVWPWERDYSSTPFDISAGYVQKQLVTTGNDEKVKESPSFYEGDSKWLSGFQIGFGIHPCLRWGLGLYTGIYYEFYVSSNDDFDYSNFQQHELYIPVHALFRVPFSEKVALWLHGGVGFNVGIYSAYKASDSDYAEDLSDYYGETLFSMGSYDIYNPKRLNMAGEIGLNLRINHIAIGATYSKGITDHECYEDIGEGYKSTLNKLSFNLAYTF